ncbi:glycoside hydrolase family protein [Streptomonospora algeriensis]|uniref:Glycoside hydrolase family protein n=1 Tax=Streptomonospora algeriensis TaxID=995084 RepID=A0ABW3BER5_9ACTN
MATLPVVACAHRGAAKVGHRPCFGGADAALRRSGAGWYYTWSTAHPGVGSSSEAEFVPMIWGADAVTDQALAEAEAAGPHLLGFNEPDMGEQADMTVEQALELWPRLEETGSTLGSPAVAYGADSEGGWLDRFMTGAEQRGYRVDFITVHWYGSDFRTGPAVEQLRGYLTAVHEKYGKPVWLTEYALIDFAGGTPRYPAPKRQAAFVSESSKMLSELAFLKRYAWFGLGTDESGPTTALYRSGPTPTEMGRAFRAAP